MIKLMCIFRDVQFTLSGMWTVDRFVSLKSFFGSLDFLQAICLEVERLKRDPRAMITTNDPEVERPRNRTAPFFGSTRIPRLSELIM